MANTYFKLTNESLKEKYTDSIINEIQKDLFNNTKFLNDDADDIYSMITEKQNTLGKLDINVLFKCYLLKQLLKEEKKPQFTETANPNIKKCSETNKFFKLSKGKFTQADEIESVADDGSYTVIEQRETSSYKIKKSFDINDRITSIQLIDRNNNIEMNTQIIIEVLGLKKIFAYKFKYAGYSGESRDFITGILNKLNGSHETRFYMDKYFNYFEWSHNKKAFVRNSNEELSSPLMVDYEFVPNGNVIRKEYTGVK